MPRAYLITAYKAVRDPDKLAAYAKLASPAIQAAGGRFLARGTAVQAYEQGLIDRTVIIEFDSLEAALKLYDSPAYGIALDELAGSAERDMRVVEGVD